MTVLAFPPSRIVRTPPAVPQLRIIPQPAPDADLESERARISGKLCKCGDLLGYVDRVRRSGALRIVVADMWISGLPQTFAAKLLERVRP